MPAAVFIFLHLHYLSYKTIAMLYICKLPSSIKKKKMILGDTAEDFHEISTSLLNVSNYH